MKIADIEIPHIENRGRGYRFFEMVPALISYSILLAPIVLSMVNTTWAAYFLITYVLLWFVKAVAMTGRVLQGHKRMNDARILDWTSYLQELEDPESFLQERRKSQHKLDQVHAENLQAYIAQSDQPRIKPSELINVAIIAALKESMDVLEPTVQSVIDSHGEHNKNTVLVFAYEARGGPEIKKTIQKLVYKYEDYFLHTMAVEHPADIKGEVVGKGGNITYAGRELKKWLDQKSINYNSVLVTTLDSDNRPDPNYFAAVSYSYIVSNDRSRKSFQPIPLYFTNIWDVPMFMRIIATGNSLWMMVSATRRHMLRNFSAHAQPMSGLVETDFWSVRTITEDGHQYWRSYFKFDGKYEVLPVYVPVHQDAVLASDYRSTLRAQFVQLRRWAYGATDIAYVLHTGFRKRNTVNKLDLLLKLGRLIEGHVSWATAALLVAFAGWIPLYANAGASTNLVAQQLPDLVALLQRFATIGIFITMYLGLVSLPPRPERVSKKVSVIMYLQWLLLPMSTIVYNTFAAINAQTRLLLGLYLDKFDFTEKGVRK